MMRPAAAPKANTASDRTGRPSNNPGFASDEMVMVSCFVRFQVEVDGERAHRGCVGFTTPSRADACVAVRDRCK